MKDAARPMSCRNGQRIGIGGRRNGSTRHAGLHRAVDGLRSRGDHLPDSPSTRSAVAGGCPSTPRSSKTYCEPGTPPAFHPNSRQYRTASSLSLDKDGSSWTRAYTVSTLLATRPAGNCCRVNVALQFYIDQPTDEKGRKISVRFRT